MQAQADLVQCTFARPEAWRGWKDDHDADRPMQGLHEIFTLGVSGYRKLLHMLADGWTLRKANMRARFARKAGR